MAVDLMATGTDSESAISAVRTRVRDFWEYYRRYTTTAIHAAATAALTAFGLLIFIDSRFAWLAIASYVFPPVIHYVTGTDAEHDSDRDPDADDRPPGAVTHRETGPGAAGSADAATNGPHTTGTDAGGDADRDFDGPDRDADGADLDFDGPDMDADGADADADGADADADGIDADADGNDGDTDSDSDDGDTDTDGTGSDTDSDGDDGDTDSDSDSDDGDTDTDG